MPSRLVLVKEYVWLQMILVVGIVILGGLYAIGLWTQNNLLLVLVDPAFTVLSTASFLVLFLIPLLWILAGRLATVSSKERVPEEMKERLTRLSVETARRMNLNRAVLFAVSRRSSVAMVRRKRGKTTIIVGERLMQAADEAIIGIVGHEIGHVLKGHLRIKALSAWTITISFLAILIGGHGSHSSVTFSITVVFALLLATIPLNWKVEYDADKIAAQRLGPDPVVSGLEKLRMTNFDGIGLTHPPLSKRIQRIKTTGVTKNL